MKIQYLDRRQQRAVSENVLWLLQPVLACWACSRQGEQGFGCHCNGLKCSVQLYLWKERKEHAFLPQPSNRTLLWPL